MHAADAAHPNPVLEDKLRSIYALRGGPGLDLEIHAPYLALLSALGDPHLHLPPVVHVAGTNGKGSVIAMIRAVCAAAGYRTHVYTSPHLVRFNERIVLAGEIIGDGPLESLLDEVLAANAGAGTTFFEITTALAFLAFARSPADICLLETGLGGRLDCTNVLPRPAATAITRIGYDHMEYLGATLPAIAAEKGGIIKPGVPCVLAPQADAAAVETLAAIAAARGAPLIRAAPAPDMPETNMTGPHQRDNESAALAVLKALEEDGAFTFPPDALQRGLQAVHWPGRLERLHPPGLPPGCELWIDGGHNESAARALAAQAALWAAEDGKKLHLVLGMMKTKDPAAFLEPLAPYLGGLTCVDLPTGSDGFSADALARIAAPLCPALTVYTASSVALALHDLYREQPSMPHRVLITGSLYLCGNILTDL